MLRFAGHLPHPPEKVWRALTEPEHLAAWFPAEMEGERRAGAPLQFPFRDGEGETMDGEMLVFEPPSVLQYRWDVEILRFELQPTPDGCALTFTSTLAEVGTGARDGAGWHACLDLLAHHLAGTTPPWMPDERWAQLHPGYVARLPDEASTIGRPTGQTHSPEPARRRAAGAGQTPADAGSRRVGSTRRLPGNSTMHVSGHSDA